MYFDAETLEQLRKLLLVYFDFEYFAVFVLESVGHLYILLVFYLYESEW